MRITRPPAARNARAGKGARVICSRSLTGLGVCALMAWAGSCRLPTPPPAPREPSAPEEGPFLRIAQVTDGTAGEDLFPCPCPDGRIFFSSNRDGRLFHVYWKDTDRPGVFEFTRGDHNEIHPTVSGDLKWIAYASDRSGRWAIYREGLAPRTPRLALTDGATAALGPAWAPMGLRIAYFERSQATGEWDIVVEDIPRGERFVPCAGMFPSWSPDGNWIAYHRPCPRTRGSYELRLVSLKAPYPSILLRPGSHRGALNPTWSPDGRWIAFNSLRRGDGTGGSAEDLWAVRPDGTGLRPILLGPHPEWRPAWATDGRVYFSRGNGEGIQICSIAPGYGMAPERLTHDDREGRGERLQTGISRMQ